jgi:hypothetical protein
MKEGISILPITDNEAKVLRENGHGENVHCGHGSYKRKYVTTAAETMKFLEAFRKSKVVK